MGATMIIVMKLDIAETRKQYCVPNISLYRYRIIDRHMHIHFQALFFYPPRRRSRETGRILHSFHYVHTITTIQGQVCVQMSPYLLPQRPAVTIVPNMTLKRGRCQITTLIALSTSILQRFDN